MLVGLRDRLVRNRTQLSNAVRGYAAEFGLTAAKGKAHLDPLLERIQSGREPATWRASCSRSQAEENAGNCRRKIDEVDAKLMAWHQADECSRQSRQKSLASVRSARQC